MLSISKPMSAGAAADYYEKIGKEEYYLAERGIYCGKLSEKLGLADKDVSKENFRALLDGKHPVSGKQLVGASKFNDKRRAGWDLTFSAPKSISILTLEDPRLKEAHDQAVKETMALVESRYAITKVDDGAGGQKKENTGNLSYASFVHHSSRVQDPQLHTHNFVFNLTDRGNGKHSALELRELHKDQKIAGQEYRSILAHKVRELGYGIEVTDRKDGLFEIKGVDKELIQEFSGRRQAIEKRVVELRASGQYPDASYGKLHEIANIQTRPAKAPADAAELRKDWNARTKDVSGKTIDQIKQSALTLGKETKALDTPQDNIKIIDAAIGKAVEGITATEAVMTDRSIVAAALKLTLEHAVTGKDVEAGLKRLEVKNELLHVAHNDLTKSSSYTTPEMVRAEWRVLDAVQQGKYKSPVHVDRAEIHRHLETLDHQLTVGQAEAVTAILDGPHDVAVIQGDAGTGKTAAMKAVKDLAQKNGIPVRGLAFTGKAADELLQGADIESQTLARFLGKPPEIDQRGEIWIVDEAGMVGARDMAKTLELAKTAGAKVALVGDVKQFLSISAGRSFEQAQEQLGFSVVRMDEAMRPKTSIMRDVFREAAAGQTDAAIDILVKGNRVVELQDRGERIQAVVKDYISATDQKKSALVLTARNKDRLEINDMIRTDLVKSGRVEQGDKYQIFTSRGLSGVEAHFADSYKVGDELKMFERVSKISAGATASVVGIDPAKNLLTLAYTTKEGMEYQVNIDPSRQAGKYAVYERQERSFGVGDRVVTLSNDKILGVQNGSTGSITGLSNGLATILMDSGESRAIDLKKYSYIDHGYAVTEYKSQGATVDKSIMYSDTSQGQDKNSFYVGVTRGREDAVIYTDNTVKYREQISEGAKKTSALDFREVEGVRRHIKQLEAGRLDAKVGAHVMEGVQIKDTFTTSEERSVFSRGSVNLGAGFKSYAGWDATVGGIGFSSEKKGLLGIGAVSFNWGEHTSNIADTRITTSSRSIITGEHAGTVVHSRTERSGNSWRGHFATTGTMSKKGGEKVKVKETGYHVDALIGKYTHSKRVEQAKDGSKQITTTKSFARSYWGEKKTILLDGTIKVTKWKGTRSILTGKLKITHSVTTTYTDQKEAFQHTQPLSRRLFFAVAEKLYSLGGLSQETAKKQIDGFVGRAETNLREVRDNMTGRFTRVGSVQRIDGSVISVNETGIRQGDLSMVRRSENIISGAMTGRSKILELTTNSVGGKQTISGLTKIFLPSGHSTEKSWSAEKEPGGKWIDNDPRKLAKEIEKDSRKQMQMEK